MRKMTAEKVHEADVFRSHGLTFHSSSLCVQGGEIGKTS